MGLMPGLTFSSTTVLARLRAGLAVAHAVEQQAVHACTIIFRAELFQMCVRVCVSVFVGGFGVSLIRVGGALVSVWFGGGGLERAPQCR